MENEQEDQQKQQGVSAPGISLPKGGGAIKGMGEKFAANPATGTGSMTVPIATSPGRSGFGPQLSLSYDSGAGNGPFGLGWNLSLPAITRKTDKGLPSYQDADESDVFILSGAEDLVPEFEKAPDGQFVLQDGNPVIHDKNRPVEGENYQVRRYRPRIEGLFARIERWTNTENNEVHWRSISRDNITTVYGRSSESRIEDPEAPEHSPRIFSWLICESYDDKGNAILYQYAKENSNSIQLSNINERNRTEKSREPNCYLKRIKYGNKTPIQTDPDLPREFAEMLSTRNDWLFEVVFDYDEGHYQEQSLTEDKRQRVNANITPTSNWTIRQDPFSSYRPGFEVRTYRLCHRVLMFHHFPEELETDDYLVRSTEFSYQQDPVASYITSATQSGFKREDNETYLKKSIPPLEFEYSEAKIQDKVQEIDSDSLKNLPNGLDGGQYQWIDLDGEGISGILTEQGDAWLYKRNTSPLPVENAEEQLQTSARFAPVEKLKTTPTLANLNSGRQQLLDLAGDGQLDVVDLDSQTPGFYERDKEQGWQEFKSFKSLPNINWQDPNLKFIDLTGDGHADIMISEEQAFSWYPSLAEQGFASGEYVRQTLDDETGPRIVFADSSQSIYLADFSGDGLTDLVRIRNSEVCYWPNLGYGRFGAKVTMDNAPHFDIPDQFDQRRIRLADIDGSGVTDILYLKHGSVEIYYNESGNRWSEVNQITNFPKIDNLSSVLTVDLLGNGTACLVWSSPLPENAHSPIRYIDLMGGQKPHLLIKTDNNLGATTEIQYTPSTKFYLQDQRAGKPWITRIPFPVHVVEKVTISDKWRNTRFSSVYSYHHGYFDGQEREFRGFGRVEQIDIETFGEFAAGNTDSPYITDDKTLYQPPVKTVTWFHTGAAVDRKRILSQYEREYFPNGYNLEGSGFQENILPEPDADLNELNAEEWRQALRACKGMLLRQEVYELDVDALEKGEHRPVKLFSTAYHNCHIRNLQPQADNRHAVFLVTESEAISYHYELDLHHETLKPDPRIAHTLNLNIDEYGNIRQSVAVAYPRIGKHSDSSLPEDTPALIESVQNERHLAYTETRYTNDIGVKEDIDDKDNYRLRVPCEVLTYELTGISPEDDNDRATTDLRDNFYFTLDELQKYRLSLKHQTSGEAVISIAYHELPNRLEAQKRRVEHSRILYFKDDLSGPLPLNEQSHLGLPYETYTLALTEDLLTAVLADKLIPEVQNALNNAGHSGYLSGTALTQRFPDEDISGQYWIRSGIAGFAEDAAQHFYLPERYTDPFGNTTTIAYDGNYDLYIQSSVDPIGNTVSVEQFDYRVLAPTAMKDINDNLSEVVFDTLGMPTAMAVKGKDDQADNLDAFDMGLIDPDSNTRTQFFTDDFQETEAERLLDNATARHVYDFGEQLQSDGSIRYAQRPPNAAAIMRERHVAQLATNEKSPLQVAFEYSDGLGNVLVQKVQAEPESPEGPRRWIASGKTILNNKGNPVKQYEPYFTDAHQFEEPREMGVTPVMYYDAVDRLVRTELPDGTYSKVEFSPWQVKTFDPNDTVNDSQWYADRNPTDPETPLPRTITGEINVTPEQRSAWLTMLHQDTPAVMIFDSLGREVIAIAHNREENIAGEFLHGGQQYADKKQVTFTKLDAEGKPLWIRDARGNLVMRYIKKLLPENADVFAPDEHEAIPENSVPCYDIAGNLLFQHSMDGGDRWLINDAAGQPFYAWDVNERAQDDDSSVLEQRIYHTTYDQLRRPLEQRLKINQTDWQVIERFIYGKALSDAKERNLRGQLYQHYDGSGLVTNEGFDFKGNLVKATRQMNRDYAAAIIHWPEQPDADALEDEIYSQTTEYDALNRMTRQENWHLADRTSAIYSPQYNERGLLQSETLSLRGQVEQAIRTIQYDAKGQRTLIEYGNGSKTTYRYDDKTYRLINLKTERTNFVPEICDNGHASTFVDNAIIQDLHYWYDSIGNITEIHDDAHRVIYHDNQQVKPHNQYQYDALYRLISASGKENGALTGAPTQLGNKHSDHPFPCIPANAFRSYTQYYQYDKVGNIDRVRHQASSQGSWTRDYGYAEDSNHLQRTWTGDDETNAIAYAYDTHGSMLNLNNTSDEYRLSWDADDMIHHINLGGGGQAFYNYDADKQRSRTRIERNGSTVEERLYLGGMERYRRWKGGDLAEEIETYHLFDGEQRVLLVEDVLSTDNSNLDVGVLYRYQYGNHLDSVGLELDAVGAVISYEEYHPYGTTAYRAVNAGLKAVAKRYRYTGMERDEESGLGYHGARFYLAWVGRWASVDPIGVGDGVNLYGYVGGNPVALLDPSGTQSQDKEVDIVTGVRPPVTQRTEKVDIISGAGGGRVRSTKSGVVGLPSDTTDGTPPGWSIRFTQRDTPDGTSYEITFQLHILVDDQDPGISRRELNQILQVSQQMFKEMFKDVHFGPNIRIQGKFSWEYLHKNGNQWHGKTAENQVVLKVAPFTGTSLGGYCHGCLGSALGLFGSIATSRRVLGREGMHTSGTRNYHPGYVEIVPGHIGFMVNGRRQTRAIASSIIHELGHRAGLAHPTDSRHPSPADTRMFESGSRRSNEEVAARTQSIQANVMNSPVGSEGIRPNYALAPKLTQGQGWQLLGFVLLGLLNNRSYKGVSH